MDTSSVADKMLEFEGRWRFESPGPVGNDVVWEFQKLIERICGQDDRKYILEHFKSYFATAAGTQYYPSSNES